jgi:hypothetical protein
MRGDVGGEKKRSDGREIEGGGRDGERQWYLVGKMRDEEVVEAGDERVFESMQAIAQVPRCVSVCVEREVHMYALPKIKY